LGSSTFLDEFLLFDQLVKEAEKVFRMFFSWLFLQAHDFRHSHVALLIHQEEKPYIIKEHFGLVSIQTTYDIYGHFYSSKQRKLAGNWDSWY
jgi:integrase